MYINKYIGRDYSCAIHSFKTEETNHDNKKRRVTSKKDDVF